MEIVIIGGLITQLITLILLRRMAQDIDTLWEKSHKEGIQ